MPLGKAIGVDRIEVLDAKHTSIQHMPTSTISENRRRVPDSTVDLLELFWRRRSYLIVCTSIAIFLGVIYSLLATPMYESTADVLVVQKHPQVVTGDNQYESGFEDYLATHLAVVASPLIVERAIKAANLGSLESFADVEDPEEDLVDTIIGDLEVEGGSRDLGENADSIMTLSYYSSVPEDAPIVVQALLDSYEDFHSEVYRGMSDSTVGLIGQARDLLKNDLSQQEATYSKFRQSSPLVASGTEEVNPLQDRLAQIELRRSELLLRRAEVESQLLAIDQAKRAGSDREQLMALVTELRQQATTQTGLPSISAALETQLIQLVDDEQGLLEHYGPNHPHVLTMRQRIADTRQLFALPSAAHMPERESGDESLSASASRDPVAVYTQYLQQELNGLQIAENLLTGLYNKEHDAAKEHSIFQLKDGSYRRSIERTEALYDVVITRLQEASLVKDFGGFETTVIAPPRLGEKVGPRRRIILPVAALAGMFLGCMLAMVVELKDDSFRSCEQIQQQLGLPVVGQIPSFSRGSSSRLPAVAGSSGAVLDPMLCSYHSPRTLPAESFRRLRTALYFHSPSESVRVLQVSGASAEDGASTVAANLAISLAQTGKRVLLIDADLQQQRQQQMFGISPPKNGLAAIITSDVEPVDAICQSGVDNLWLLPSGTLPDGPCELFTSPQFGELINLLRDSYDHILIDTEPLLSASDPLVIASHTDGVLLTLQLARGNRQRARQATQMMDRLGVSILGIVASRLSSSISTGHPMEFGTQASSADAEPRLLAEQTVT